MAAHTEIMERFESAIFKQCEEINDRMAEMFELLNELTASQTLEKPSKSEDEEPLKEVNVINEVERRAADKPTKSVRENVTKNEGEEPAGVSSSHARINEKHRINEKLIEGLVENHRKEDEKTPFILGTPFLTKAKALIKLDKGTITLRSRKSKISFHRIPKPHCRIEKRIKNDIEPIAPTMTVSVLVLEWEEKIKIHQEKEMKFDQWRSKIFNVLPTPIKEECELEDGGGVTNIFKKNKIEIFIKRGDGVRIFPDGAASLGTFKDIGDNAYVLLVYCTTGCVAVTTVGIEQGFLSQNGSGVGRGVKESLANTSVERTKHVNVVNAGLESFPTVFELHGIQSF
ncbi:hypothetical protein Tco_1129969, partial [Tanacetum coccineum]